MFRPGAAAIVAIAIVTAGSAPRAGSAPHPCTAPIQECLDRMCAALKSSGWVGIEFDDARTVEGGYRITRVLANSPAEKAGLEPGDVLRALNGVRMTADERGALAKARKAWAPGQAVTYTVRRQGTDRDITLTLAPMPTDVMARWIGEHMLGHVGSTAVAAK